MALRVVVVIDFCKHGDGIMIYSHSMLSAQPERTVYCQDALTWLKDQSTLEDCSIITSMPDISEFPQLSLDQWKAWFTDTAKLILSRLDRRGVAIFYQTDIKTDGIWVNKGYLCQKAAEQMGCDLLWHKIVCRKPVGTIAFGRPGYAHLLCFSRGPRNNLSKSVADILPQGGETTWTRGMGTQACLAAVRYVIENTETRTVVAPFCGHGTVLAVGTYLGLRTIGIELSAKRSRKARSLQFDGTSLQFDSRRVTPQTDVE